MNFADKANITISDIKIETLDSLPSNLKLYMTGPDPDKNYGWGFMPFNDDGTLTYSFWNTEETGSIDIQVLAADADNPSWEKDVISFRNGIVNEVSELTITHFTAGTENLEVESTDYVTSIISLTSDYKVKFVKTDYNPYPTKADFYVAGDFSYNIERTTKSGSQYIYSFTYDKDTMTSWGGSNQVLNFKVLTFAYSEYNANTGSYDDYYIYYGISTDEDFTIGRNTMLPFSNSYDNSVKTGGLIDGNEYTIKIQKINDTIYAGLYGTFDTTWTPAAQSDVPYIIGDITNSAFVLMNAEANGTYTFLVQLPDTWTPFWGETSGMAFKFTDYPNWDHGSYGYYTDSLVCSGSNPSNIEYSKAVAGGIYKITFDKTLMTYSVEKTN